MKKLQIILLCFAIPNCIFAQNYYSKKEMYQDFDAMYNIIKNTCGQIYIRNKITNSDILFNIKQQRKNIDTISNSLEFIKLLDNTLSLLNDKHCVSISDSAELSKILNDTLKLNILVKLWNKYYLQSEYNYRYIPITLYYQNGNFYNVGNFKIDNNYTGNLDVNNVKYLDSLPLGAKIISINDIQIDTIVQFNIKNCYSFYSWDTLYKKPYFIKQGIYIPFLQDTNIIKYEFNRKINNLYFKKKVGFSISNNGYLYPNITDGFVDYFLENKLLYIRLARMTNYEFYKNEILAKSKNVEIDKIVIDIRNNGGGQDEVWMQLLETLIKDTIFVYAKASIGYKYTKPLIDSLSNIYGEKLIAKHIQEECKIQNIDMLNNETFLITNWGRNLAPKSYSINYDGKIYILQNKFIYSSAGSLSNLAQLSDNLVSIGETTGVFLGFGVAPMDFSLPNSGFSFQLSYVIDFTNTDNKMWNFYHDNVEIPVKLSIEDIVRHFNTEQEKLYSKDFLYNHDPVFQKVLELK